MADELDNGVDQVTDQSADVADTSLADDLRAAYDQSQVGEDAPADGRTRDPAGRFAPKGADPVAGATDDPAAARAGQAATTPGATDPGAQASAAPATAAPEHWTAGDKALYAKAAPEVMARWVEREQQFSRAYTPLAQFHKEYEGVHKAFEPHLAGLRQAGLDPTAYVNGWVGVEQRLMAKDPAVFVQAVKNYGFDPAAVIAALGGQPGQAPDPEYADPVVTALKAELAELRGTVLPKLSAFEQTFTSQAERAQQEALAQTTGSIETFASQKSADGQLAHPHFAEVKETMEMLAAAEKHAGKNPSVNDLPRLYKAAIYADETVREKVLAEARRADEASRTVQARSKANAARAAGSSVAGTPSAGQSPGASRGELSLRDQLREAHREVTGRV